MTINRNDYYTQNDSRRVRHRSKEEEQMRQRTGRKLLGVLLALVLVLGLVPGMSVTAKAATMNNPKSLSASEVTSCSSMDGLFSKFTGFNAVSLDDAKKWTGYPQADTLLIT